MTTKETVVKQRVQRKPLHQRGPHAISGEKDPNFVYRIVNDTGSRIHNFQQAGYELVTDNEIVMGDSRVSDSSDLGTAKRVVGNDGNVAYLMRIKKEYYDEDQSAKQAEITELENTMKSEATQGRYGSLSIK